MGNGHVNATARAFLGGLLAQAILASSGAFAAEKAGEKEGGSAR